MNTISDARRIDPTFIGPYSNWPRRGAALTRSPRRLALLAGGTASLGVFLHCVAPMLIAV